MANNTSPLPVQLAEVVVLVAAAEVEDAVAVAAPQLVVHNQPQPACWC